MALCWRSSFVFVVVFSVLACSCMLRAVEARTDYMEGASITLFMNTIGPYSNPSETYEYYSLPFCRPSNEDLEKKSQTIGENLQGDRQFSSLYDIPFKVPIQYQLLCEKKLTKQDIQTFIKAIDQYFFFSMVFDNLPLRGFIGATDPLVTYEDDDVEVSHYLFKHLHFTFLYNGNNVIYGNITADASHVLKLDDLEEADVEFSYSVDWYPTNIPYRHRRKLLREEDLEIHWLSIMNSLVLVVLLTAFVALIISRILSSDYNRYAKTDEEEQDVEDYGWKLVHGDVFRFPSNKSLLSSFVGIGVQLLSVALFIVVLSAVGILYPEKRGSLYTYGIVLYAFASAISGAVSSGFYKKIEGEKWAWNIILTSFLFSLPVALFTIGSNFFAIYYQTTSAIPLTTLIQLGAILLFVGFPLTIVGGITGRRISGSFDAPVRTKKVPREIPSVPWYRHWIFHLLLGGFLPFSAIYIELYYIYSAIWGYATYTLFTILFLVFLILLMVTACINVALTYFQLSSEDHRWWWRSFLSGGMTGVFIFAYSIFYYWKRSGMTGTLQMVKYFSYITLVCYLFFVMLGTVGFYSSLIFVRYIYKNLKCD